MKTITQILFLFFLPNITNVFGQNTFIVTGTIINVKTKLPVDSSVFITITINKKELYKTYCSNDGKYSINISDTLNGKQIIVSASQDRKKIERMFASQITEPCSFLCWDKQYIGSKTNKITLKADSIKEYITNFALTQIEVELRFPTIYFKKNEVTMLRSDDYLNTDSAFCDIKGILKCKKEMVIEVAGNCASDEKDKENLSSKRAQLVTNKLISLGINPKRIIAKGYSDKRYKWNREYVKGNKELEGESPPAYLNKTDYEWQTVTFGALRNDFVE